MKLILVITTTSVASALALCFAVTARAQQMEPRAYSLSPVGTNFFGVGYFYSSGSAALDPSLPVQNVSARVHSLVPFYSRTFGLFGRTASILLVTPFVHGFVEGDVREERQSVTRTGFGDPAFRFAVNLIGGPALAQKKFRARKRVASLGASISVVVPAGQYYPDKLINIGANRWAFKPELGLSYPAGPWDFELYAGVWLFTINNDFFGGQVRRQDPIATIQAHIVYTFRPRMWASLDFTYYTGGETTVNGQRMDNRQDNTRGGLTFAIPVSGNQSVKLVWSRGVSTRIGTDFETFGVSWQLIWF